MCHVLVILSSRCFFILWNQAALSNLSFSPFTVFQSTLPLVKIAVKLPFGVLEGWDPLFFIDLSWHIHLRYKTVPCHDDNYCRHSQKAPLVAKCTTRIELLLTCQSNVHISVMQTAYLYHGLFSVFPPTCSDNVCSCVCVCRPSLGMADLSALDLIFCICCSFSVVLLILVHPFQTAGAQYFCQKPICPLSWLISSLLSSSSMSPFVSALLTACMFHVSIIEQPNIILFKNSALRDSNLKVTEMFT